MNVLEYKSTPHFSDFRFLKKKKKKKNLIFIVVSHEMPRKSILFNGCNLAKYISVWDFSNILYYSIDYKRPL